MASVLLAVVDPAGERVTMRVGLMSTMADVVAALEARTGVLLLEHELRCGDGSALDPSTYVADQFAAALSTQPSTTTLPTPVAHATNTAMTHATSTPAAAAAAAAAAAVAAATAGKMSPDDPAAKAEGALEALLCADLDAGAARALRGERAVGVGGGGSDGGGEGSAALANVTLRAVSSVPLRRRPRYVLLFGGQGAQRVGMGGAFWRDGSAAVRSLWAQASALLGYDLLEVCVRGPAELLRRTSVAQPAIFVSSLAALSALRREVPEAVEDVAAVAGFSLGEFSALVFGGALRFADGLRLVKARGEAMEEAANSMRSRGGPMGPIGEMSNGESHEDADAAALRAAMEAAGGSGLGDAGAMLSVSGVADDKLERLCGECRRHCDARKGEVGHTQFVQLPPSALGGQGGGLGGQHGAPRETVCQISNFLFPRGRVVSGHSHACDWLAAAVAKAEPEARVKRLRVAAAFHSPFMAPAQRALEAALAEAPLRMPRMPVYSNVTGRPYTSVEEMRQLLGQQLTAGVRWEHTMRHMLAQQRDAAAPADGLRFVDVGPGKQLAAMLRKLDPEKGKACIVMGDGCL